MIILVKRSKLCKLVALTSNSNFINKLENKFINLKKLNIIFCDLDLQYEIILSFLIYNNSRLITYLNILQNNYYQPIIIIYLNSIIVVFIIL